MPLPYMRAVCVAVAQHPYGSPGIMPMEASRAVVSGPYVDRSGSRYVNPSYGSTTGLGRRGTGRGRPTAARRTSDSRPMPQDTTGGIRAGKGLTLLLHQFTKYFSCESQLVCSPPMLNQALSPSIVCFGLPVEPHWAPPNSPISACTASPRRARCCMMSRYAVRS